jgi:hypothetical protein
MMCCRLPNTVREYNRYMDIAGRNSAGSCWVRCLRGAPVSCLLPSSDSADRRHTRNGLLRAMQQSFSYTGELCALACSWQIGVSLAMHHLYWPAAEAFTSLSACRFSSVFHARTTTAVTPSFFSSCPNLPVTRCTRGQIQTA